MKRAFRPVSLFVSTLLLTLTLASFPAAASDPLPLVPAPGRVTLVDLGAQSCIPCKMMAPILKELEQEYRDKAAVMFIDVWIHNDQVDRFNLRAIPTQIVYDRTGKEVFRHEGFLSKENLRAVLDPLLER